MTVNKCLQNQTKIGTGVDTLYANKFQVMFGGLPFRTKRSKALKNSCISIFLPNYSHHMAKHIAESVIAIRVIRGMMRVKGRGEGTKGVEEEEEEKGDLFTRCCA